MNEPTRFSPAQARSRRRRWLAVLASLGATAALPGLYMAAVAGSTRLLAERADPRSADTILVLGGDGPARAWKAAALWRGGYARHAVIAGDGDCLHIRDTMVYEGVPREAIAVECLSRNTRMNAFNAAPLLEVSRTRSALVVTSWFHTGRALRVLRLVCPGIIWIPAATEPPPSLIETATGPYGPAIAKEYVKAAGYRVLEWLEPIGAPAPGRACSDDRP